MKELQVKEVFKVILGDKGDNEWGSKAVILMNSIISFLMKLQNN